MGAKRNSTIDSGQQEINQAFLKFCKNRTYNCNKKNLNIIA